jgi:hypothetical protein
MRFIVPIRAVSSSSAGAPRSSSSASTIASVTATGVWLMASAYSMARRSPSVNTSDSRQRGISRALRSSRPRWRVMK